MDAFIEVKRFFGAATFMDTFVGRDDSQSKCDATTPGTNGVHSETIQNNS